MNGQILLKGLHIWNVFKKRNKLRLNFAWKFDKLWNFFLKEVHVDHLESAKVDLFHKMFAPNGRLLHSRKVSGIPKNIIIKSDFTNCWFEFSTLQIHSRGFDVVNIGMELIKLKAISRWKLWWSNKIQCRCDVWPPDIPTNSTKSPTQSY